MSNINEESFDRLRQLAGLKPSKTETAPSTATPLVARVKLESLKPRYVRVGSKDVVAALLGVNNTVDQILAKVAEHYKETDSSTTPPFEAKIVDVDPSKASKVQDLKELKLETVQNLDATLKEMWDEHDLADGWEIVVGDGYPIEHAIKMVLHDFIDDYVADNPLRHSSNITSYSI